VGELITPTSSAPGTPSPLRVGDLPQYLPTLTLRAFVDLLAERFPAVVDLLAPERIADADTLRRTFVENNEFERDDTAGRGDSYRLAQREATVRQTGMVTLARLALGVAADAPLPNGHKMLDVLGGDGAIARVLRTLSCELGGAPCVITGDVAARMVEAALEYDLPAIRQSADYLILKDASVDCVIVAYGFHHLSIARRAAAVREAHRVLRPGGRIVVHDFEESSAMAHWFTDVVDAYSVAGHRYRHFSESEMVSYLRDTGFVGVERIDVYDPFIVKRQTESEAYAALADYVYSMYGLVKLGPRPDDRNRTASRVWGLIERYMRYEDGIVDTLTGQKVPERPSRRHDAGHAVVEVPRVSLVAVGTKPG